MTIEIRSIGTAQVSAISAVSGFFAEKWQTPPGNPPYPAEVLHSLVHAGGAVYAAYDGDRLAGATAAVFGPPAERSVYSLVAAAATCDRGTGFALKQAQRQWALANGAHTMRWTFDPLVGRNARFNLVKLGATATATSYETDFYGPMADGVNYGDESDRLTAVWDLRSPRSYDEAAEDRDRTGTALVRRAPDGGPLAVRTGDRIWCRVPRDSVALRAKGPQKALRRRRAVREVFTAAFAEGFAATGMSRDGWYLLTPCPCSPRRTRPYEDRTRRAAACGHSAGHSLPDLVRDHDE